MTGMIDMTNDRANIAYIGAMPWHGLGSKLPEDAPFEVWCDKAGMSHTVERSRVCYQHASDIGVMEDKQVLWRSDNKEALGIVSPSFKIFQPREALQFMQDVVESTGKYKLDVAGCLDGGKKYWATATLREAIDFGYGDTVKPNLLIATACDGTMATTARHTSIRTVCNNTLQMSLGEKGEIIKITHRTVVNTEALKSRLGLNGELDTFIESVDDMINTAISKSQFVEALVETVAKKDESGAITNEKYVKQIVADILHNSVTAPGQNLLTARGTQWGAVNAVTNFVDFHDRAQSTNNRFKSSQFGKGAELKSKFIRVLQAA